MIRPDNPDDPTNYMSDSPNRLSLTHSQFLIAAALLEGGLVVVAFVLGWMVGHNPTETLSWNRNDFVLGVLTAGPLLLLLAVCLILPSQGIQQIREFLRDTIGPFLFRCRLMDLALLAALAGLCEEILFRGLVFQFLRQFHPGLAIIVSNLLFGLAHLVTPLYALLAAMAGLYLTALMVIDPSSNLLLPIVAHAVYDFVAFLVIIRDFRRHCDGR